MREADAAAQLEVAVLNVGANVNFPLLDTSERVFRKVWELACYAGFLTAREAARQMLPRGRGCIFVTRATASMRGGSGWTLADLAARSRVSRALASKVERGEASPTAALLGRLSAAFGLTMSQFFARVEGGGDLVSRAADQPIWRDPASGFVRRSLSPPGSAPLELVWGEMPAGSRVSYPAASYHFIADQQIVVIEGRVSIEQGGVAHELEAGDCLRFGPPRDAEIRNSGDRVCRYLVAVLRVFRERASEPGPANAPDA